MLTGAALVVLGLAGAGWSVRAATGGVRPLDLFGALGAPLAISVALFGVAALAVPDFLAGLFSGLFR